MRYRLLVFDFDGTLADSFPFFLDAIDTLADTHGFHRINRSQLDMLRAMDARQLLKHVGLPLWKTPRVGADFKKLMAEHSAKVPLFPGVAPVLQELHAQGARLAMLTSNSEQNVRTVLGSELAALFDHFHCGSALFGKRDKLRRLLKECGVPRDQVLCIGDEARDLEAAHAEKLDFGAVAWGYTKAQALCKLGPAFMFEHPAQFREALRTPAR